MSENTKIEAVETTEVVEVTEKVGKLAKVKGFFKDHKGAIIVGLAAAGATAIGIIKMLGKSSDDADEYDSDYDEYVDDAEECEEIAE